MGLTMESTVMFLTSSVSPLYNLKATLCSQMFCALIVLINPGGEQGWIHSAAEL